MMTALKFLLAVAVPYFALVLLMVMAQRRFIYFPTREYPLTPGAAGLPYEEATLRTADGLPLAAWWVPGADVDARVFLCFHGNATNLAGMVDRALWFRARGDATLLVEYRGYGDNPGTPTERGLDADAAAAYAWLAERGVTPDRIVIYGHSLGAAVAARLAAARPAAGVVVEGAFPSVLAMVRHHYWWLLVPAAVIRDRFETAAHLANARSPVLVVHGEADEIVPARMGKAVFERAAEPKRLCLVPGATHNEFNLASPEGKAAFESWLAELGG